MSPEMQPAVVNWRGRSPLRIVADSCAINHLLDTLSRVDHAVGWLSLTSSVKLFGL